jgi:ParB-like chromosome segregation protein Spo0J
VTRIRLDQIAFDAGTQIRAAIDQQVVSDYAEAMTNGATFPPIVLFHDGNQYYIADGFHRFMAVQRLSFVDIDSDVRAGTRDDALWFALGANKTNGKRLTDADKRHAVLIAARTFLHHKSQHQIADQVGCSQGFVSLVISRNNVGRPERVQGLDGQTYPATKDGRVAIQDRARELLRAGKTVAEVMATVGIGRESAYRIQREVGKPGGPDKSRSAVKDRRDRMREMATEGYSSRQIAAEIGMSFDGCRAAMLSEGIDVPADKAVGKAKRHDSNRIVGQIVMDAENLIEGVNLVDFADLDRSQIPDWLRSLQDSREKLGAFIRRLMKEQQHGEAA